MQYPLLLRRNKLLYKCEGVTLVLAQVRVVVPDHQTPGAVSP
jgi:hypothetical protein